LHPLKGSSQCKLELAGEVAIVWNGIISHLWLSEFHPASTIAIKNFIFMPGQRFNT
jgi:hypothetical protein